MSFTDGELEDAGVVALSLNASLAVGDNVLYDFGAEKDRSPGEPLRWALGKVTAPYPEEGDEALVPIQYWMRLQEDPKCLSGLSSDEALTSSSKKELNLPSGSSISTSGSSNNEATHVDDKVSVEVMHLEAVVQSAWEAISNVEWYQWEALFRLPEHSAPEVTQLVVCSVAFLLDRPSPSAPSSLKCGALTPPGCKQPSLPSWDAAIECFEDLQFPIQFSSFKCFPNFSVKNRQSVDRFKMSDHRLSRRVDFIKVYVMSLQSFSYRLATQASPLTARLFKWLVGQIRLYDGVVAFRNALVGARHAGDVMEWNSLFESSIACSDCVRDPCVKLLLSLSSVEVPRRAIYAKLTVPSSSESNILNLRGSDISRMMQLSVPRWGQRPVGVETSESPEPVSVQKVYSKADSLQSSDVSDEPPELPHFSPRKSETSDNMEEEHTAEGIVALHSFRDFQLSEEVLRSSIKATQSEELYDLHIEWMSEHTALLLEEQMLSNAPKTLQSNCCACSYILTASHEELLNRKLIMEQEAFQRFRLLQAAVDSLEETQRMRRFSAYAQEMEDARLANRDIQVKCIQTAEELTAILNSEDADAEGISESFLDSIEGVCQQLCDMTGFRDCVTPFPTDVREELCERFEGAKKHFREKKVAGEDSGPSSSCSDYILESNSNAMSAMKCPLEDFNCQNREIHKLELLMEESADMVALSDRVHFMSKAFDARACFHVTHTVGSRQQKTVTVLQGCPTLYLDSISALGDTDGPKNPVELLSTNFFKALSNVEKFTLGFPHMTESYLDHSVIDSMTTELKQLEQTREFETSPSKNRFDSAKATILRQLRDHAVMTSEQRNRIVKDVISVLSSLCSLMVQFLEGVPHGKLDDPTAPRKTFKKILRLPVPIHDVENYLLQLQHTIQLDVACAVSIPAPCISNVKVALGPCTNMEVEFDVLLCSHLDSHVSALEDGVGRCEYPLTMSMISHLPDLPSPLDALRQRLKTMQKIMAKQVVQQIA